MDAGTVIKPLILLEQSVQSSVTSIIRVFGFTSASTGRILNCLGVG